jgi:signal transduction histidine kinase
MKTYTLEPGLLHVFRFFALFEVIVSGVSVLLRLLNPNLGSFIPQQPFVGLLVFIVILLYLRSTYLQEWLGKFYLPLAIVLTYAGVLTWQLTRFQPRINQYGYLSGDSSDLMFIVGEVLPDIWQFMLLMAMMSLIIGWQYSFRPVLWFNVITAVSVFIGNAAFVPLRNFEITLLVWFLGTTNTIYVGIGYIAARVMHGQRKQRAALEAANRQLAIYAATLEELAVSRERNRIALELHDTLAHTLTAVALQLEAANATLDKNPAAVRGKLEQAGTLVREGLADTRRALQDLRAKPLDDLGLGLALREYATQSAARGGVTLQHEIDLSIQLPRATEQTLYRIAEESIANSVRHSNARCIQVTFARQQDGVVLAIQDDGTGFDPNNASKSGHYGLQGMRERAEMIGGHLNIDSAPGRGTTVCLRVEGQIA